MYRIFSPQLVVITFVVGFVIESDGVEPSKTRKHLKNNMIVQESAFLVVAQLVMPKSLQKENQNPSQNH